MTEFKQWSQITREVFEDVQAKGWNETFGLSPRDEKYFDATKCRCGGGCESVLECWFWYWMRKTPAVERGAQRQAWIGKRRVDCLCDCDGESVVIELDGKAFHTDARAEWERDKELLATVGTIIHFPFAAMWWFPEATFSVLATWYPRFKLRATDLMCCTIPEFLEEIENSVHPDSDFPTRASYLDWAEPNFELWSANEAHGWVGSPKAWFQKWNVRPITVYPHRGNPRRIE